MILVKVGDLGGGELKGLKALNIGFSSPSPATNLRCANPGTFRLRTKTRAEFNCAYNPIVLYLVKVLMSSTPS